MEDDEQNRGESEQIGQDVETLEREKEFNGWRDNAHNQTRDDMRMSALFTKTRAATR